MAFTLKIVLNGLMVQARTKKKKVLDAVKLAEKMAQAGVDKVDDLKVDAAKVLVGVVPVKAGVEKVQADVVPAQVEQAVARCLQSFKLLIQTVTVSFLRRKLKTLSKLSNLWTRTKMAS